MITIKSKELKYYGNSRIVLNHKSYQICDLTVFGRTLVLEISVNAYLHPNILYLQRTKRYPRRNQSSQWLVFPNNHVYITQHSSIEYFSQKLQYFIAQKLHKNYCKKLQLL